MTKYHLSLSLPFFFSFLSYIPFEPHLLFRITRGAFKTLNAWPHPTWLKSECLEVGISSQFIKAPQDIHCTARLRVSALP